MGLIMLILIGTVPTAYALNRAMPASQIAAFRHRLGSGDRRSSSPRRPATTCSAIRARRSTTLRLTARASIEGTYPSLAVLMREISNEVTDYGSIAKIPFAAVGNTRNDMYLASEAIRFLMKDKESELTEGDIEDPRRL